MSEIYMYILCVLFPCPSVLYDWLQKYVRQASFPFLLKSFTVPWSLFLLILFPPLVGMHASDWEDEWDLVPPHPFPCWIPPHPFPCWIPPHPFPCWIPPFPCWIPPHPFPCWIPPPSPAESPHTPSPAESPHTPSPAESPPLPLLNPPPSAESLLRPREA